MDDDIIRRRVVGNRAALGTLLDTAHRSISLFLVVGKEEERLGGGGKLNLEAIRDQHFGLRVLHRLDHPGQLQARYRQLFLLHRLT